MPPQFVKPPNKGLSRWVKRVWRQLKREQLTPGRFGVAVGLGLWFGLSPFWGFQMIVAQVLAHLLKLNRLAVAAGVSISAPPFLPFEVLASVQLGQRLLHGTWAELSLDYVRAHGAAEIAKFYGASFAVGALVLATLIATPAGFFAAWRMKKAQAQARPELSLEALEALDDALPALPLRYRLYVAWKVRLDPIYPMVLPLLAGRRAVLDLGAGPGILAFFVKQASPDTQVRCVEWDPLKVDLARKLLQDRAQIDQADARTIDPGQPDALVLLDVLHYCPPDEQRAWLSRLVAALAPGGVLVLRELDPAENRTSEKIEQQAVSAGWNKGAGVFPWPISQLIAHLESLGLEVTRTPKAGKGVFKANALVVARRRAEVGGSGALEPTSGRLL
ncbi:MAG: DUF2062 domain-containing protein [Archangiaceae bacterium]|nr:DUF2062 domain-containing protein [Archangiaceae bacterium]